MSRKRTRSIHCAGCGRQIGVTPFAFGRTIFCDDLCEKASRAEDPAARGVLLGIAGRFDFLVPATAERNSFIRALYGTTDHSSVQIGQVFGLSGTRVRQIHIGS